MVLTDKIFADMKRMMADLNKGPDIGPITGGARLMDMFPPVVTRVDVNPIFSYASVPVHSNPMFPMRISCAKCDGTGEGDDSTYCEKCSGAGAQMVEGIMQGSRGSTTMIVTPLPKAFAPHWPTHVKVPLRDISLSL